MKKLLFLILLPFFQLSDCFATSSVRLPDSSNPSIVVTTTSSFSLKADGSTSQPTASGSAINFYVPVRTATGNNNGIRHISANRGNLPLGSGGSISGTLSVPLELVNNEGNHELYVATFRQSDSKYIVVAKHSATITGNATVTFSFTLASLCTAADDSDLDCSNLGLSTEGDEEDSNLLYFFLHDDVTNGGALTPAADDIDPSDSRYEDGIFLDANVSNKVDIIAATTVTLNDLRRGDASLKASYTGSGSINNFDQVIAFEHTGAGTTGEIGAATGVVLNEGSYPAVISSEITIGNLVNGRSYTISLAFADKYGFSTNLSNFDAATPEEIQTFLEEEGCYLLSAGFGDKHYVIDYFKHIRDDYLLKNSWGKAFVDFYYATAPKYTHYIYKNPWMSKVVRGMAYTAYFVFNYFITIVLFSFVSAAFLYRRYVALR